MVLMAWETAFSALLLESGIFMPLYSIHGILPFEDQTHDAGFFFTTLDYRAFMNLDENAQKRKRKDNFNLFSQVLWVPVVSLKCEVEER